MFQKCTILALVLAVLGMGTFPSITTAQDHLDGIGDSIFLFNDDAALGSGFWALTKWNPSGSTTPPPSFFGTPVDGGTTVFADASLTQFPQVGDINGDGIADVVISGNKNSGAPTGVMVGRNTGTTAGVGDLAATPVGNVHFPDNFTVVNSDNIAYFLGDVSGDKRSDAIAVKDDGGGNMFWTATTSDSNGLDDGTGSGGVVSTAGFGQIGNDPIIGDFNGDGLTDIGQVITSGGSQGFVQTLLSKDVAGNIGLNSAPTAGNVDVVQGPGEVNTNHIASLVGDLNGDGLDDIVTVDDRFSNGSLLWVAKLTGASGEPSGFGIAAGGGSFANGIFAPDPTDTVRIPMLADINGDGRDDLVLYHEFQPEANLFGQFLVAYTDANGDLSTSGFNDSLTFDYTTLGVPGGWTPLAGQVHLPESTGNADFDGDNDVDGADFLTWQRNYLTGSSLIQGDANGDGNVDDADLDVWKNQFGIGSVVAAAASASTAIPEPGSILLIGLGGVFLLGARRNRRS